MDLVGCYTLIFINSNGLYVFFNTNFESETTVRLDPILEHKSVCYTRTSSLLKSFRQRNNDESTFGVFPFLE